MSQESVEEPPMRTKRGKKPDHLAHMIDQVDQVHSDSSKIMTFKSQNEPIEHQHHLQPNGEGLDRRGNTVGDNFGERGNQKTLQQMTNPFLSRAFNNVDSSAQSNLYSYNPSLYPNPLKSDINSPYHLDDDSSNLMPVHQESQGDPSSSSMSGYDLKGMMMKH